MKKLLLCLCLGLSLMMTGCSSINKEHAEQEIFTKYNAQLKAKGADYTCTKVELVPDGNSKLKGFANLSNGKQMKVDVTLDPVNNEMLFTITPL